MEVVEVVEVVEENVNYKEEVEVDKLLDRLTHLCIMSKISVLLLIVDIFILVYFKRKMGIFSYFGIQL